ncbi:MAG: VapC toxin family PIN domain ribonuclease [Robiginitomaculum sp.]|nr:MAG: VapC toxin family PIN domain ribonuclease [Robiginitomaculum sp.]
MIILDTNVISELMRSTPDRHVLAWFASQKPSNLAITAIAIAEIQRGILRLPVGKRRANLSASFLEFVEEAFHGRILAFDASAAYIYGEIASEREKSGFNTDSVDLMISAIVKNHKASIATRNTKDFKDCGIKLINPWEDRSTHG